MMRVITLAAATVAMLSTSANADSSTDQDPLRRMAALEQPDAQAPRNEARRSSPMKLTITEPANAPALEIEYPATLPAYAGPRPRLRQASPREILAGAPIHEPPASLWGASDLNCLAVAIYHEARNQPTYGQRAVGSVVMQRAAVPHRWGDTPCDVVIPVQFSFMIDRYNYAPIDEIEAWQKAVKLAAITLIDGPLPELHGADHYHTTDVSPEWAPKITRVRQIEDHIFYADPASRRRTAQPSA